MLPVEFIEKYTGYITKILRENKGHVSKLNLSKIYDETVKLYNKVKIHSDINEMPKEILLRKFPNETDEEFKYRCDNYEPVTPSFWNKALGTVNRIWNKQNYSIEYKDKEDGVYFTTDYPVYGSLENYFKTIVTNQKVNDPNAVLCVVPYEVPEEEGEVDQSVFLEPVCNIYASKDVIDYKDDVYTLVLTSEKSVVKDMTKEVQAGMVFMLFDDVNYYKIIQVGKKQDYNFAYEIFHTHNLGYVPTWKLIGIPVFYDNELLYHSYFVGALPLLNKAVVLDSTLDVATGKHTYPILAHVYEPCGAQGCDHGRIKYFDNDTEKYKVCGACHGTGELVRFSPHSNFKVRLRDPNFEGDSNIPFPGITHVEPPTNNMAWTKETVYEYIYYAFTFLNIDVSNSDVKGSETALGKKIDREELFAFLLSFSAEIFHLLKEVIGAITYIRYSEDKEPQMTIPNEFSIKNSMDITAEYKEIENFPSFIKGLVMGEYVNQRFGDDEFTKKFNKIVSLADPYLTFNNNDLVGRKAAGIIDTWQIVLHDNIAVFIEQKLIENKEFLDGDPAAIVTELENMAKTKAAGLTQNSQTSTEAILKRAQPIANP